MPKRDLSRELDDTPDAPAAAWKPAVGDRLIGRIAAREHAPSKFGAEVERLIIETDGGDRVSVYVNTVVLQREIAEKNPRVGDRIAIQRLPNVAGKNYHRFRVLVDHASSDDRDDAVDDLDDALATRKDQA